MNTDVKNSLILILGFVAAWLTGAILCSLLGLFTRPDAPPTFSGLFLVGPVVGFLAAYVFSKRVREALLALPLWAITATHGLRLVGIGFVIGSLAGALPPQFGWPAGGGDAISAVISIPLAVLLYQKRYTRSLRARFIAWNILGLLGLLLSVTLGLLYSVSAVGVLSSPASNTRALSFLPYSLMPTFYVPVLMLLHLLALRRRGEIPESSPRLELS